MVDPEARVEPYDGAPTDSSRARRRARRRSSPRRAQGGQWNYQSL